MTKRELVLEAIRVECATEGRITQRALNLYVSNRISYHTFQQAAEKGMAQNARRRLEAGYNSGDNSIGNQRPSVTIDAPSEEQDRQALSDSRRQTGTASPP